MIKPDYSNSYVAKNRWAARGLLRPEMAGLGVTVSPVNPFTRLTMVCMTHHITSQSRRERLTPRDPRGQKRPVDMIARSGASARNNKLTAIQRSEIAKKAAAVRWKLEWLGPPVSMGKAKMNAVQKTDLVTRLQESRRGEEEGVQPTVLKARPVKNPRTYAEMLEHAKKGFQNSRLSR